MKKNHFFGLLAIVTMLALGMAGCSNSSDGSFGNDFGDSPVLGMQMVSIPKGSFTMGSGSGESGRFDNETTRKVTIGAFAMGKFEVTQAQYERVMGYNPSFFREANLPVETVTWYDAIEFCNKLSVMEGFSSVYTVSGRSPSTGYPVNEAAVTANWSANGYRLPTEAEWEYACRAGGSSAFHSGGNISNNTGWYVGNSGLRTHTVGSKPANKFGLYDMHGNIWEWCWDWYSLYSTGEGNDPRGPAIGAHRVSRGGGWSWSERYLRSAYRGISTPDDPHKGLGLRVVRTVPN
jgi:formylglycine-generating enzyme required for sulfatase activity